MLAASSQLLPRNAARTCRSSASDSPAGTGPSCSTSSHGTISSWHAEIVQARERDGAVGDVKHLGVRSRASGRRPKYGVRERPAGGSGSREGAAAWNRPARTVRHQSRPHCHSRQCTSPLPIEILRPSRRTRVFYVRAPVDPVRRRDPRHERARVDDPLAWARASACLADHPPCRGTPGAGRRSRGPPSRRRGRHRPNHRRTGARPIRRDPRVRQPPRAPGHATARAMDAGTRVRANGVRG